MTNIAVVEDENSYRDQLKEYIDQYACENNAVINVSFFCDGDEIVEQYKGQFDIILMDIEMQFMDGMTAAEHIREIDKKVIIIFITNMAQYAIRGYAVEALDYVLKPISYFAFSQRLERAIGRLDKEDEQFIKIKTKKGAAAIPVSQIYWIESQGHRLTYNTSQGIFESTSNSMKEIERQLEPAGFYRCNNSYLVNLSHVKGIYGGDVMVADTRLQISRAKKNDFLNAVANYAGEN